MKLDTLLEQENVSSLAEYLKKSRK